MVDAGSAGCMTFRGLRKYICEKSATRVLALLNIACHGLAGAGCAGEEFGPGGENDHLNALKLRQCIECIEANRDLIVGIKARNQQLHDTWSKAYTRCILQDFVAYRVEKLGKKFLFQSILEKDDKKF